MGHSFQFSRSSGREREGGEESSHVQLPHPFLRLGPPTPGSPDVGRVWGSRAPLPPAPRHLGALRRPLRTAPNRYFSIYSPTLPGDRAPDTSAIPATASRSSSGTREDVRPVAMSGPKVQNRGMLGPSLATAAARRDPAPAT